MSPPRFLEVRLPHVTLARARSLVLALPGLSALPLLARAACGGGDGSPPVPSHLDKTAGDQVSAAVASPTPSSPTLRVTDANGKAMKGVIVNFAVAGGGSLAATVDTSDATGIATSGAWTLGSSLGQQTVTATSPSIAGVSATFIATAVAGPASQLAFITQPPVAVQAGAQFQGPVVELRDRFG